MSYFFERWHFFATDVFFFGNGCLFFWQRVSFLHRCLFSHQCNKQHCWRKFKRKLKSLSNLNYKNWELIKILYNTIYWQTYRSKFFSSTFLLKGHFTDFRMTKSCCFPLRLQRIFWTASGLSDRFIRLISLFIVLNWLLLLWFLIISETILFTFVSKGQLVCNNKPPVRTVNMQLNPNVCFSLRYALNKIFNFIFFIIISWTEGAQGFKFSQKFGFDFKDGVLQFLDWKSPIYHRLLF